MQGIPQKPPFLHSMNLVLTAVGTMIALLGALWLFAKPFVVQAVAAELEEQVTTIVKREMVPLSSGLAGLIRGNIRRLNDSITEMEYKRDQAQASRDDNLTWTLTDERLLRDMKDDLNTQAEALAAMTLATRRDYD